MHTRLINCAGLVVFALTAFSGAALASEADEAKVFDPAGRRDPFTFAQSIPTPPHEIRYDPPVPAFDLAAARSELTHLYNSAENAFIDTKWNLSLKACEQALTILGGVPDVYRGNFGREESAFLRLRTAADRLQVREDAERQFEGLNISLTGVIARDASAQAIVNSKVVSRGAVVAVPNAPQDVIVFDIRPNEVVFLYRGFRMTVAIKK